MKYNNRFLVSDTETGGLFSAKKIATIDVALTEIAVIAVDNEKLEIVGKNSWLLKPYDAGLEYNPRAAEVSGINKEMCEREGIDIEIVHKEFVKVLKDNKVGGKKPIFIFHNKKFDIEFIKNFFLIFKDDFFKYVDRIEDTLEYARLKFIEKPNFKLGSVAEYCGVDLVEAHRAEVDAISTAKIWIHFMKSLRGAGSQQTNESQSVKRIRDDYKF